MKPKDLTLEQLKAVPCEEYYYICMREVGFEDCVDIECVDCPLDTPDSVQSRIKELESQKQ